MIPDHQGFRLMPKLQNGVLCVGEMLCQPDPKTITDTTKLVFFFLPLNDDNCNNFICNKHLSHISIFLHCLHMTNIFMLAHIIMGMLLNSSSRNYLAHITKILTTRTSTFLVCFSPACINMISEFFTLVNLTFRTLR